MPTRTFTTNIERFHTKGEAEDYLNRARSLGKKYYSYRLEPAPKQYSLRGIKWQVRETKKRW